MATVPPAGRAGDDRMTIAAKRWIRRGVLTARSLLLELPCLVVPASRLEKVTAWVYSRQTRYLPGGDFFQQALFDWELKLLRTPPFPSLGRLLVGGAGAGRELVALLKLGYRVVAFEPSALVESAFDIARGCPEAEVQTASYSDVVRLVRGEDSPLAKAFDEPFDAIVLGWGSLSHVVDRAVRHSLLPALRALAPSAPILCSFLQIGEPHPRTIGHRIRLRLRGRRVDPNLRFWPHIGFVHLFTREEIASLAHSAGYDITHYDELPYPHALLVPVSDRSRDSARRPLA
jgi:hypothetical protein